MTTHNTSADMQGIANDIGYHGEPEADEWLRVVEADRIRWQLALNRARERGLWIEETRLTDVSTLYFTVESYSARRNPRRDLWHIVLLNYERDGTPRVSCDCAGWEFGSHPCQHAALALDTAHGWPSWFTGHVCGSCGLILDSADALTQHRWTMHNSGIRGLVPEKDLADMVQMLKEMGETR